MKKLVLFLILIFTTTFNYAQESSFPEITKTDLIDFINKAKVDGKIDGNAVVVLDEEIILDVEGLNDDQIFFGEIRVIEKGNNGMKEIYGERAYNGVIMIQSIPETPEDQELEISDGKVIFFIGNKEVAESELQKLNPDLIKNVQVIKSKDEIVKYTDKECDGIVIINMK